MVPTADPLSPPSIASESATQKSRDYGAALRANYLLTEKSEFSLGGAFKKLQFLDNTTANVGSRVINGDTSLRYKFTPLFSSGIFFNTSYNTFENGTDSRVFAGGSDGGVHDLPGIHGRRPRRRVPYERDLHRIRDTGEHGYIAVRRPLLGLFRAGSSCRPLRDDRAGRRGKPRGDHPEGNGLPFRERPVRIALVGRPARDVPGQPLPGARCLRRPFLLDRVPQRSVTAHWSGWKSTCPGRDSASPGAGRWDRISPGTPPFSESP